MRVAAISRLLAERTRDNLRSHVRYDLSPDFRMFVFLGLRVMLQTSNPRSALSSKVLPYTEDQKNTPGNVCQPMTVVAAANTEYGARPVGNGCWSGRRGVHTPDAFPDRGALQPLSWTDIASKTQPLLFTQLQKPGRRMAMKHNDTLLLIFSLRCAGFEVVAQTHNSASGSSESYDCFGRCKVKCCVQSVIRSAPSSTLQGTASCKTRRALLVAGHKRMLHP